MKSCNIHEAKTHLSRLLTRVAAVVEIVIARAVVSVARLVPVGGAGARVLGSERSRVVIAPDFDAPIPPEVLRGFEG